MNINLTLIGQTIMFAMFVWFCMKFIWPPLVEAMAARKKAIEDGLKAAELGKEEHALAQKNAEALIESSKTQAAEIIANADKQASVMIDNAKGTAYKSRIMDEETTMAGKTGTSQVRRISMMERETGVLKNEDLPWEKRDHAIFVAYAPFKNPKYAVSIIIEHGGSGAQAAAPIGRDILLNAFYYNRKSIS